MNKLKTIVITLLIIIVIAVIANQFQKEQAPAPFEDTPTSHTDNNDGHI